MVKKTKFKNFYITSYTLYSVLKNEMTQQLVKLKVLKEKWNSMSKFKIKRKKFFKKKIFKIIDNKIIN